LVVPSAEPRDFYDVGDRYAQPPTPVDLTALASVRNTAAEASRLHSLLRCDEA
jgi:hypothetical protein